MRHITNTLLKIEERARVYFEKIPFIHAFLAGIGVIIFWRGVWELLDRLGVSPVESILLGSLILGGVGVFIQTFLGNTLIIKNVAKEEREEKEILKVVGTEMMEEEIALQEIAQKVNQLIQKKQSNKK